MPVLYGVLMYMGFASLKGMQFIDRIFIMFMPQKYQPDYIYLRHVQLKKVHIFTGIQVRNLNLEIMNKCSGSISYDFHGNSCELMIFFRTGSLFSFALGYQVDQTELLSFSIDGKKNILILFLFIRIYTSIHSSVIIYPHG